MSNPPRPKHVPTRTCITCRGNGAKRGLVRLVRDSAGRVQIDTTGKRNGRGAYLCKNPACWHGAVDRNTLVSALRLTNLTEEDRAMLTSFARTLTTEPLPTSDDVSTRNNGG